MHHHPVALDSRTCPEGTSRREPSSAQVGVAHARDAGPPRVAHLAGGAALGLAPRRRKRREGLPARGVGQALGARRRPQVVRVVDEVAVAAAHPQRRPVRLHRRGVIQQPVAQEDLPLAVEAGDPVLLGRIHLQVLRVEGEERLLAVRVRHVHQRGQPGGARSGDARHGARVPVRADEVARSRPARDRASLSGSSEVAPLVESSRAMREPGRVAPDPEDAALIDERLHGVLSGHAGVHQRVSDRNREAQADAVAIQAGARHAVEPLRDVEPFERDQRASPGHRHQPRRATRIEGAVAVAAHLETQRPPHAGEIVEGDHALVVGPVAGAVRRAAPSAGRRGAWRIDHVDLEELLAARTGRPQACFGHRSAWQEARRRWIPRAA